MITNLINNRNLKSQKRNYFDVANNPDHTIYKANTNLKKAFPKPLQIIMQNAKKEK